MAQLVFTLDTYHAARLCAIVELRKLGISIDEEYEQAVRRTRVAELTLQKLNEATQAWVETFASEPARHGNGFGP